MKTHNWQRVVELKKYAHFTIESWIICDEKWPGKIEFWSGKSLEKVGNFMTPEEWEPCFYIDWCIMHVLYEFHYSDFFHFWVTPHDLT